jgi:hypothetical protein
MQVANTLEKPVCILQSRLGSFADCYENLLIIETPAEGLKSPG